MSHSMHLLKISSHDDWSLVFELQDISNAFGNYETHYGFYDLGFNGVNIVPGICRSFYEVINLI